MGSKVERLGAALAGGIGGFATTVSVQAGLWFRRTLGALPRWDA